MNKLFKDLKTVGMGFMLGFMLVFILMVTTAAFYPPPASSVTIYNNISQISVTNLQVTNLIVNEISNITDITVDTNVVINQKLTVKGTLNVYSNFFGSSGTFTNGVTNQTLTANTLLQAGGSQQEKSIPNAIGYLLNNGAGVFSYTLSPGVNTLTSTNNILFSTNPVTAGNIDASLGIQFTNCTANPTIAGVVNVPVGQEWHTVLYLAANGANRTLSISDGNIRVLPAGGTYVVTNNGYATFSIGGIGSTFTGAVFTAFP